MAKKSVLALQAEANKIAWFALGVSVVTLVVIIVGGIVAYLTFFSQQAYIVHDTASYCPAAQFLFNGQTFYNFTFVNAGQQIGNINVSLNNYSISAFLSPLFNNGTLLISGGQSARFRLELDQLGIAHQNYSYVIKVKIDDGARGTSCLIQTCSYSAEYNSSNPTYNNPYFKTVYKRTSDYRWSGC